jgi:hypothetical protein
MDRPAKMQQETKWIFHHVQMFTEYSEPPFDLLNDFDSSATRMEMVE